MNEALHALTDGLGVARVKANIRNLQLLLTQIGRMDLSQYSPQAVARLNQLVVDAEDLIADKYAEQDDVDALFVNISNALNDLTLPGNDHNNGGDNDDDDDDDNDNDDHDRPDSDSRDDDRDDGNTAAVIIPGDNGQDVPMANVPATTPAQTTPDQPAAQTVDLPDEAVAQAEPDAAAADSDKAENANPVTGQTDPVAMTVVLTLAALGLVCTFRKRKA